MIFNFSCRIQENVDEIRKIKNVYIRDSLGEIYNIQKLEENRLKWLGHVIRREYDYFIKVVRHRIQEIRQK